ncbi:hypothetical protein GCM10017581_101200 [Dactylosporangium matsuzakiense]|uniref:Uncharacterized protein n=1 Tax=Dactylosporangium matsuzakiense TaxID=53360 RepID=A0A9W6KX92_9ACTN|nr:hypothetical protein GCM10017581_101200 [Dactylosporangium matsuzakiense]
MTGDVPARSACACIAPDVDPAMAMSALVATGQLVAEALKGVEVSFGGSTCVVELVTCCTEGPVGAGGADRGGSAQAGVGTSCSSPAASKPIVDTDTRRRTGRRDNKPGMRTPRDASASHAGEVHAPTGHRTNRCPVMARSVDGRPEDRQGRRAADLPGSGVISGAYNSIL